MDKKQQILDLLRADARLTARELGVMLNIPADEAAAAVRELEEERLIVKYTAVVNQEKLDTAVVKALIEVKVTPQRDMGFDAIAEKLYRIPEVSDVYLMSGAYDLMVIVEGHSLKDVALFVSERLSALDNVLSTATHFILKQYKIDGVVMVDAPIDERMVVMP
ncbi:MAG: Lrp/AsnC family transcriptional regulator [Eubacteriales bacterium]|nr:Lrp/AsnC family transcriptional regulator [Eubacteriales bacterium]